ncbi:hypothetical protein [Winogradskyella pulchriflava]|uniref:Uncharacterized protein n=1 Tax=Winogradskyella pulchriflava TaxID=1110688 RepID=A0ABV6Q7U6_9FLAO
MDLREIKKYTSTEFMYSGGASFKTHKAKQETNAFKFVPTLKFAMYTSMYLLLSVGCFYTGKHLFFIDSPISIIGLLLLGASLVFLFGFFYFLKDYLKSIVFSKNLNYYYKGFINIKFLRDDKVDLNNIAAIQILGEITSEALAPFNSFELNLVLKDSERVHIIDHSNLKSIIDDANNLSKFLDVPIWTNE